MNDQNTYTKSILDIFPSYLSHDVKQVINCIPFSKNTFTLIDSTKYKMKNMISKGDTIHLDQESITIPYRVYFSKPTIFATIKLSKLQKTILHCIFSTHHNGYVREKSIKQLFQTNHYFVIPFIIQQLGGYVVEILQVIQKNTTDTHLKNIQKFCKENPKYWKKTESRIISYWHEYYRTPYPSLNNYPGQIIANKINQKPNYL